MLLQAALNGALTKADHPGVPISRRQLARDAAACAAAGAGAIHVHARDRSGRERLDAKVVNAVVADVRAASRVPVGVTTGAWIEPDPKRRLALIRVWNEPDYASVNVCEEGSEAVMAALVSAGIGIEAGVWSVEDAERLAGSGYGNKVTRIMIEPVELRREEAIRVVAEIHHALDHLGLTSPPRLQHGDGEATWILLQDAVSRGIDTRIGLEDTLHEPSGQLTSSNAALVRVARDLGAGEAG